MHVFTPVTGALRHVRRRTTQGPHRSGPRPTRRLSVLVTSTLVGLVTAGLVGTGIATPASAATTPSPAPSAANEALTPDSGLLFGAYVAKRSAATIDDAVAQFEDTVGRKLDVHRIYRQWDEDLRAGGVATSVQRGRTPVLSVSSKKVDGTKTSWASIARGDHDAAIATQAAAVASLGAPIFMTFQHEPDWATGFGTPEEYRAAWRHYVDVYRAKGVTNVVWTWIVTPTAFASGGTADALYPGDDVVDWVGYDVYNWNGCSATGPTSWSSVATQSTSVRTFAQNHGKPIMIAEWGSVEDTADPQRKATWLRDSMATWTSWPEVKAVLYFHQHGTCPWWTDSSATTQAAFNGIAADPAARTRTSAFLRVSQTHGNAPLAVTLDGSRSSGAGDGAGVGIASWTLDHGDGTPVVSGTGTPPAGLTHTYQAGTFATRLTVTDTAGRTASDEITVTAAPAPTLTGGQKDVTTTGATLQAFADLHGYAGTVQFEWGTTTAYGTRSPVTSVPVVSYVKMVNQVVTGLQPGTTYHVRTTATTPAGTTVLTSSFETAGPPTSSRQYSSGSTRTSTTFAAQVHPHRLATTAKIEWGTTTSLGNTSPVTQLAGLTYEKTITSGLVSGLAPNTTYYYRVVATNSSGTFVGPVVSMKTPR